MLTGKEFWNNSFSVYRFIQISFLILFITSAMLWLKMVLCNPEWATELGGERTRQHQNELFPSHVGKEKTDRRVWLVLSNPCFHSPLVYVRRNSLQILIFNQKSRGDYWQQHRDLWVPTIVGNTILPAQLTSKPIRSTELLVIYVFKDPRKSAF